MARYRKYGRIHPRNPGTARRIISHRLGGVDTAAKVEPAIKAVPRMPTVSAATAVKIALEPGQLHLAADAPDAAEVQRDGIFFTGSPGTGVNSPASGLLIVGVLLPAEARIAVQTEGDVLPGH